MSELLAVQDTVQRVAEAIAAALKVEVEIIDNEHIRVGGTGSLKSALGQRQKWGHVNEYVLRTRQHFVMINPGYHQICQVCELKGNCYCKAGIFCPINLNGKCLGIISLMGFNDNQKDVLLNNSEYYMEFIVHMADLLAGKASEQKILQDYILTSRQLEVVMDTLKYGVVAVDREGKISCFNRAAEKILGVSSQQVMGCSLDGFLPGSPMLETLVKGKEIVEKPVIYKVKNKKKMLLCSSRPIENEGEIIGAVESFRDYNEAQKLAYRLTGNDYIYTFDDIIGSSELMQEVKRKAERVAQSLSTVLIEGESGTGKELFARAIHAASSLAKGSFIPINCSAIPDSLLESELFGYERGAFTGAREGGKPGKFELADGGTLFLDEIGDMPLYLQAKLLRVLQDRMIERLGGTRPIPVNVRIIAATNRNLAVMVENGEFRKDLYYRLNVVPLYIPPLRERREDIEVLLTRYLNKYNEIMGKEIDGYASDVYKFLLEYDWPGNVRELENAVECAVNLAEGKKIEMEHLPVRIRDYRKNNGAASPTKSTLKERSRQIEKRILRDLLQKYGTSVSSKEKVAQILGISRATLYRKIKNLGLSEFYHN